MLNLTVFNANFMELYWLVLFQPFADLPGANINLGIKKVLQDGRIQSEERLTEIVTNLGAWKGSILGNS